MYTTTLQSSIVIQPTHSTESMAAICVNKVDFSQVTKSFLSFLYNYGPFYSSLVFRDPTGVTCVKFMMSYHSSGVNVEQVTYVKFAVKYSAIYSTRIHIHS